MHPGKICFIACIDSAETENRIISSINSLFIPEGYDIDFIGVTEVSSVCAGFNEAMAASDAKYKIYLDSRVTLDSPYLVEEILEIFKDRSIGMIGVAGVDKMPVDMIPQHGILYGPPGEKTIEPDGAYKEVKAITGDIIATQYDLPWDEENCRDDFMYSIFQSAAFRKKGYRIAVAGQMAGDWIEGGFSYHYDYNDEITEKSRQYALEKFRKLLNINPADKRYGIMYFKEIAAEELIWPMVQGGYDFETIELGTSIYSNNEEDKNKLIHHIKEHHFDSVISINFSPLLSDACKECGTKYISWVYDSPQQALFTSQVKADSNYIFSFDKDQVADTIKRGAEHVFHLPLATNAMRSANMQILPEDITRFSCDVSFIGSLYKDNACDMAKENLSEAALSDYNKVFDEAFGKWDGADRIYQKLSQTTLDELLKLEGFWSPDKGMDPDTYFVGRILGRDLANKERVEMLRILSQFGVKLYTNDKDINIAGVDVRPPLNYIDELPKAYRLSRINIGTTLHTITSGVPLRTFDIMGAGGFMLTNFQPEIPELFKMGQEIEVYHDFDEMEDKVKYYLSHEHERERIANNGYKKVSERYNYNRQLKLMLSKVGI